MVLSLLSLFTPMIRRLTYLPNLVIVNASNSFVKTLVLSSWDDLLLFSFFLMHFASSFYALFGYFSVLLCFVFHINFFFEKSEKYKNSMCFVYIGTCVPWMAIETKFSKLCISCSLDEHLHAQLSK